MLARHLQQVPITTTRILGNSPCQQALEEDREAIELLDELEHLLTLQFTCLTQAKIAMIEQGLILRCDQLAQRLDFRIGSRVYLQTDLGIHAYSILWLCSTSGRVAE